MASSRLLAAASGGRQGVVAAASLLQRGVWRPSSTVMGMRRLSSGTFNAGHGLGVVGAGQEVRGLGKRDGGEGGRREGGQEAHKEQSILSSRPSR
jgi:hypothetical protein